MTVFELLSDELQPATLDEAVGKVLALMVEQGHNSIPVVDEDERLVGTIRLAELVDHPDPDKPLRSCRLSTPIYAPSDAHLFDAVEIVLDHEIDVLSVVDTTGRYLGAVDLTGLLRSASQILGIDTPGAVIEVDFSPRDYTLGKLVHMVEEHGARVLSINSQRPRESDSDIRVTIKLSATDTVRIKAVLEHYGYNVVAVDRRQSSAEDIQQRVREFIHYLDV